MTLFSSRLLSKSRSRVVVVFFLAPASPGSVCFFSISLSLAIIGFEIREDFTILKTFPFFWPTQSHGKWKHFKTYRKHVNISSEPSQGYFKNIFRTSCEMIELLHGRDFWTFHVCFISYLFFLSSVFFVICPLIFTPECSPSCDYEQWHHSGKTCQCNKGRAEDGPCISTANTWRGWRAATADTCRERAEGWSRK